MSSEHSKRLQPIQWLAQELDAQTDPSLMLYEQQGQVLHEEVGIWPTIGCEIEINWSTLFPDVAQEYFGDPDEFGRYPLRYIDLPSERQYELDERCKVLDASMKPRFEATHSAGIPMGNDSYWEFANAPVFHWQTLSAEVALLSAYELIPKGYEHSLHVTLGHVDPGAGGPSLLLSGLELMEVNPQRIIDATIPNRFGAKRGWARRGADGIRKRDSDILVGASVGCEFRTLTVSGPEQAARIFRASQVLGAVLLAHRIRHTSSAEIVQELAIEWPRYRETIKSVWSVRNLPAESWGDPRINSSDWRRWAACIALRDDVNTIEFEAISQLDELIVRAEVALQSYISPVEA